MSRLVARFFRDLAARVYRSKVAEGYQKRLHKNEGRLFTFLDHDGVPWNLFFFDTVGRYLEYRRCRLLCRVA